MKKRLTQKDWRLISEALDMLSTDYPEEDGGHPEQERLNRLHEIAMYRGYSQKQERARPGCRHRGTFIDEKDVHRCMTCFRKVEAVKENQRG
jgi:hypothetical protein